MTFTKFWKIRNKQGLYYKESHRWNSVGKTYTKIQHLKSAISNGQRGPDRNKFDGAELVEFQVQEVQATSIQDLIQDVKQNKQKRKVERNIRSLKQSKEYYFKKLADPKTSIEDLKNYQIQIQLLDKRIEEYQK